MSGLGPTRAQFLGVQPKALRSRVERKLPAIRAKLIEIAALYGDLYNPVVTACDDAIEAVRAVVASVEEATEYLDQSPEDEA